MTTAHRPTWAPAKGNDEQGGARLFGSSRAVSAKNRNSHLTLKERKDGQATARDLEKRDLKLELEEKERKHFTTKKGPGASDPSRLAIDGNKKEPVLVPKAIDADDSDEEDDSDDDDDDDDDDTAALLAELERIKKERAEESARKEHHRAQAEQHERQQAAAKGNPLLDLDPLGRPREADFNMKRKWDDDVVFKNQARDEPIMKKRFINDTIRSDFHKRFLNRYIK